ncbi:hypothetical protein PAXRUDRAFT_170764 [Paxillus rubicundulus Ve08.2h10]|uniref:Uncharacterized protein n=1 Tax=Paxillus rubicundulus Ve08.2h10 TaxID=930991 RepID=A0A0D0DEW0_9AGAM|nr:hypothetical protein PAXRUDRAFT_170764 [Paxillus rubicundulus Ve08.2h10]
MQRIPTTSTLLCQDLEDSQIPHCTKIREDIIGAWQQYFMVLQAELAISVEFIELTMS